MTVKIDNTEPNVFPVIEKIDARDSGRDAEVILATRIEGQLTFVTIKLSYRQAGDLWAHWNRFGTASAAQLSLAAERPPAHPRNKHTRVAGRCGRGRQNTRVAPRSPRRREATSGHVRHARYRASVCSHSPMLPGAARGRSNDAHKLMRRRLATSDQFSALDF
jgi:hypothetical protein